MRFYFLGLIFLISLRAEAMDFMLPAGHREAFMGNAGSAMENSPGNVLFNPAGLGFRDSEKLSLTVSGNTFGQQKFDIPTYHSDPEEMSIRPLLAAGVYNTVYGTAAVFVANPMAHNSVFAGIADDGTTTQSTLVQSSQQSFKAGAVLASSINSRFAFGISVGIENETESTTGYITIKSPGSVTSVFMTRAEKEISVFVSPGIFYQVNDVWSVGLSGQITPLMLESKGTQFDSQQRSTNPTDIEQSMVDYDPSGTSPIIGRLGQKLSFGSMEYYLDVSYATSNSYKESNGTEVTSDASWLYSFGARKIFSSELELLAGYSNARTDNASSDLFTGGLAFLQPRRSEFILGLYYLKTNPYKESSGNFSTYGVMFSSNVSY